MKISIQKMKASQRKVKIESQCKLFMKMTESKKKKSSLRKHLDHLLNATVMFIIRHDRAKRIEIRTRICSSSRSFPRLILAKKLAVTQRLNPVWRSHTIEASKIFLTRTMALPYSTTKMRKASCSLCTSQTPSQPMPSVAKRLKGTIQQT